jgi:hypothetical protein
LHSDVVAILADLKPDDAAGTDAVKDRSFDF